MFISFSLEGHFWVRRLCIGFFPRQPCGSEFSAHETSCPQALHLCPQVSAPGSILRHLVPLELYIAFSFLVQGPLSLKAKSQGSLQTILSCCSLKKKKSFYSFHFTTPSEVKFHKMGGFLVFI